jgi:ubiquinol-cytochrome c reductase iron-sulfur subunit
MADTARDQTTRRDFLQITGWTGLGVGVALAAWPFIHQMNPSADIRALATVKADLAAVEPGMAITVMWQGKPVWIRHMTEEDVAEAEAMPVEGLRDPATYDDRVQSRQWLVQIGVCTHLGCIPLGHKPGEPKGDYDGYFCPCHGSHYDNAGRIHKGPAPRNLDLPPYTFLDDATLEIG